MPPFTPPTGSVNCMPRPFWAIFSPSFQSPIQLLSAGYFTCFSSAASTFLATAAGTRVRSGYWLHAFWAPSWLITPSTVAGPFEVKEASIIWRTSASVTLAVEAVVAVLPDLAARAGLAVSWARADRLNVAIAARARVATAVSAIDWYRVIVCSPCLSASCWDRRTCRRWRFSPGTSTGR
ncbi:hypothetical protein D3C86_1622600 [compost metagenome]